MHQHNIIYVGRSILAIAMILLSSRLQAQQAEQVPAESSASSAIRYVVPGPVHEALVPLAQASQVAEIIPEPPPAELPSQRRCEHRHRPAHSPRRN